MAESDSHYNGTDTEINLNPDMGTGTEINLNPGMGTDTEINLNPGMSNGTEINFNPGMGAGTVIQFPSMGGWMNPGSSAAPCPVCQNMTTVPTQFYGQVRFLNASTNGMTVNISIDGTIYALNSRFGTLSNYEWVSDGFHTVTMQWANGIRSTLLQQTLPFAANQKVTLVLVDSAEGGLEMVRVVDSGCRNLPAGSGCFRFANMTYSGSVLDLLLSGQTIFRSVRFPSVSAYKQAVAGTYQFTAVTSAGYGFMRELPVIVLGIIGSSLAGRETVFTFNTKILPGKSYTAYLIGNNWSNASMRVIIAED